MDILIISVIFPYPINDGGKAGLHKMVEHLRQKNTVTLICPEASEKYTKALSEIWPNVELIGFKNTYEEPKPSFLRKLLNIVKPPSEPTKSEFFRQSMVLQTTDLLSYYFGNLIAVCKKTLSSRKFDIVQVDFIEIAPIVHFLPKTTPKVFVHHEIRHRRMTLEQKTLPYHNEVDDWFIANTKIFEIGILNKYDKVICVTEMDTKYLLEDGVEAAKLVASPSPVAISGHSVNKPFQFQNRLVFLGPEVHFPNLDAIDWFLNNVWKDVLAVNPDLQFDIIGKWSKETVESYSSFKNVNFLGFVESLSETMTGAIMVIPLRIGSGMRMKILEAASWNMPMLSTTVGAEGLPMEHGENCFIADDATAFSNALLELTQNKELQLEFSKNATSVIENQYSLKQCGEIREEILNRLCQ